MWKADGTSCYRLVVPIETWNTHPINCSGFALELDKANTPSKDETMSANLTFYLGAWRNSTKTQRKDTNWVWITGPLNDSSSIWQSNYSMSAFEKNCSDILVANGTYDCEGLPCGKNCSFLCKGRTLLSGASDYSV